MQPLPSWEHPSSSGLFFSFVSTFSSCWCDTSSLMVPMTLADGPEEWLFHIPTLDTNRGWDRNVIWLQLKMCFCLYLYTHPDHPQHDLDLHSTLHPPTPNPVDIPLRPSEPLFLHSDRPAGFSRTSYMHRAYIHPHIPHQCTPQACQSTVHLVTASDFQKLLQ